MLNLVILENMVTIKDVEAYTAMANWELICLMKDM